MNNHSHSGALCGKPPTLNRFSALHIWHINIYIPAVGARPLNVLFYLWMCVCALTESCKSNLLTHTQIHTHRYTQDDRDTWQWSQRPSLFHFVFSKQQKHTRSSYLSLCLQRRPSADRKKERQRERRMKDRDTKVLRLGFIRGGWKLSPWQLKHDEIVPADLMKSAALFGKAQKKTNLRVWKDDKARLENGTLCFQKTPSNFQMNSVHIGWSVSLSEPLKVP